MSDATRAETALYDALANVGRIEKSIQPAAFVTTDGHPKYKPILDSAEVRRRARSNATVTDLAQHATEAIHDALARIYVPLDRQIAEAVFCATDRYQGLTVEERLGVLADTGVTRDMYKRRRRIILLNVEKFLARPDETLGSFLNETQNYLRARLQRLAHAAANVHVAGLLARLIAEPSTKTEPLSHELRKYHVAEPAEYVLHTYAELVRARYGDYGELLFSYPTWRPGHYVPGEQSAAISALKFQSAPYEQVKEHFDVQLAQFNQLIWTSLCQVGSIEDPRERVFLLVQEAAGGPGARRAVRLICADPGGRRTGFRLSARGLGSSVARRSGCS